MKGSAAGDMRHRWIIEQSGFGRRPAAGLGTACLNLWGPLALEPAAQLQLHVEHGNATGFQQNVGLKPLIEGIRCS